MTPRGGRTAPVPPESLVRPGAPELRPDRRLGAAVAAVDRYVPPDEDQERQKRRILRFVDEHPTALHRTCLDGHLTASALVVDAAGERALLTHHRKLGRWLQLGGHVDGEGNLAAAALREAVEESGIEDLAIDPSPADLDVHMIPAAPGEPQHLHLDVRFLARAPAGAEPRASEESHQLRWVAPGELEELSTDDSVRRLFRLAFGR